ncbi:hypothetical protein O0I10_000482 [Lichtheimia ornata]|uniref:receptor protein-tyrosine kinase n=1 Tax=Lichtheimia ornata TaxID=688661 RepID=A0AAD8DJZ5_9FUNG|nr:uncharacterized protein O0I10_000482 [Lichtheimia ornata]KAJ8664203.1 hypothetical protein O0I10_000482 [Lichtheimia ornata]
MDQHYQNNNNNQHNSDYGIGSNQQQQQWDNNNNIDQNRGGQQEHENNQNNDQWQHHHDSGGSGAAMPSVPPGVPTFIPSSYEHPNEGGVPPSAFVAIGVVGGLALIAGIAIFVCCRRRKERKKETMANAYLEFSQSQQASHVFTRNKSNVPVKETEEKYTY